VNALIYKKIPELYRCVQRLSSLNLLWQCHRPATICDVGDFVMVTNLRCFIVMLTIFYLYWWLFHNKISVTNISKLSSTQNISYTCHQHRFSCRDIIQPYSLISYISDSFYMVLVVLCHGIFSSRLQIIGNSSLEQIQNQL